jgi:hypothetical protein
MDPQIAMHLKSTTNKRNHGTEDSWLHSFGFCIFVFQSCTNLVYLSDLQVFGTAGT